MLTEHQTAVCLSLMSFDLPLWSVVEASATLYQHDNFHYHLLLTEPLVEDFIPVEAAVDGGRDRHNWQDDRPPISTPRLLWLELSSSRVIMTMQGNGLFSYRHFWEQGVYGVSRYWLQSSDTAIAEQLRLRNYTRSLTLSGSPLPQQLRVEYELWSHQLRLGHYVLNLDIQNPFL